MNAGTTKKPNFGSSTREDICINKLGNSLQGLSIANEGNVCTIFSPFSWPSISLVAVHKEKSLRASRVCGGSDRAFIGGATLGFRVRMSRI